MTTYNVSNLDNNASVVTITSAGPQGADAVLQAGDRGDFTIAIAGNGAQTATINTGVVTSDKILNGTILDADINSSADINGSKLLNDSVGLTKLGGGALPTDITIASANIVNGTIVNEDIATGTLDSRYYTETELDAGQLDNRYFTETELTSGGVIDSRYYTETELDAGQLDTRYFTETELTAGALDSRYYTEAEADARFYNLDSAEEIQSGETWVSADNKVATTAAIDARVIDLVDDVGGFVPIANELSFPNANPDINNGAGTLVSIQALSTAYTSDGSGNFTIANGTVGNSTVTVNGATASTTFAAGFGMILETTTTLNTYTFHRLVPKATEVTTVAGNITNVNKVAAIDANVTKVANIDSNVTTVANIDSDVTAVANDATDIGAVAGKATEIGLLGTADAIADMALLGNADVIADMNLLATTDVVADMNLLATSDVISDMNTLAVSSVITDMDILGTSSNVTNMNTLAGISSNITTVAGISSDVTTVANDGTDIGLVAGSIANVNTTAGSISNVNTVSGSITNVNTVSTNITNVTNASNYLNNFLQLYLGEASSDPVVDGLGNAITEGDLYFNSVDKRVRVFNGSVFQNIGEGLLEVAKFANAAFNALYTAAAGQNSIDLGGLAINGAVFSNEAIATNRVSLGRGSGTFNLGGI